MDALVRIVFGIHAKCVIAPGSLFSLLDINWGLSDIIGE